MGLSKAVCPSCKRPIMVVEGPSNTPVRCPACSAVLVASQGSVQPVRPANEQSGRRAAPKVASSRSESPRRRAEAAGPIKVSPPPLRQVSEHALHPLPLFSAVAGVSAILVVALAAVWLTRNPEPGRDLGDQSADVLFSASGIVQSNPGAGPPRRVKKPELRAPQPKIDAESVSAVEVVNEAAAMPAAVSDPVRDSLRSVAVVISPHGHGSGFMASRDLLVTNQHVIAASRVSDLRVGFPDNESVRDRRFVASLLAEDAVNDLAVLRVECGVPPLLIDESYRHVNGQKVVAIGSPGTGGHDADMLENLTTDGRLGPAIKDSHGAVRWAMAMAINPGNSGGPIIDAARGHVIGVAVAKFTRTEAQSLAVPLPAMLSIVREAERATADDRKRIDALHRARYCLAHMGEVLRLAELSFNKSCEAAMEAEATTAEERLQAFNDFKSLASRLLGDEFSSFETDVTAEVGVLKTSPDCDAQVRTGMTRLHAAIDEQVSRLRKTVAPREIEGFLRDYRASMHRAKALAESLAKGLGVELTAEAKE
jgi:LSD1 subclass zinc finger protein